MNKGKAVWRYTDHKIYAVMTLGEEASDDISRLFESGEYGEAVKMDEASVKTLFTLAEKTEQEIIHWCQAQGLCIHQKRTEPSALTKQEMQRAVDEAQKDKTIGVRINDHGMLIPLKSMCVVYDLCDGTMEDLSDHSCTHCRQTQCPYRKVSAE